MDEALVPAQPQPDPLTTATLEPSGVEHRSCVVRLLCCCCSPASLEDTDEPTTSYQRFAEAQEPSGSASRLEPVMSGSQPQVSAADFETLSVLGRGTYGKVMLVRRRETDTLYAMKVLHKADILKRNQLRHTLTERSVLQAVRHPFIVQARASSSLVTCHGQWCAKTA